MRRPGVCGGEAAGVRRGEGASLPGALWGAEGNQKPPCRVLVAENLPAIPEPSAAAGGGCEQMAEPRGPAPGLRASRPRGGCGGVAGSPGGAQPPRVPCGDAVLFGL